ncbi:hypothetical protein [Sphingomonas sp. 28-63-12]|uniref:hypothetical protein n=1 Tax=Sphingomonas sp. 28-63-12 TaxID=1970434 RepID=UPI000BDAB37B|nr:MAG: hypothetical protein B7Y47_15280 [Sphingomonas sp. 28-63-12]
MLPASRARRLSVLLLPALALAACAHQVASVVEPQAPGFWLGVWHGFIFPVAAIASFFVADIGVYAVPNNGGWYDFGYFIGIVFLGVGSHRTRKVYVDRVVIRRERA